jgi:Spy/CpxP family protein refolding chaperone
MSLKNKFFSLLTVAISVVAFSVAAIAQDTTAPATTKDGVQKRQKGDRKGRMHDGMGKGMRGGKMGRHGGGMRALRGLNLTDTQKAQIKVIRENNKPDAAVMTELRVIREARKNGTVITPEQRDRMKTLRGQAKLKSKSVREQVLAVLTTEQKAQIEQQKQEMKLRRQERKNNRMTKPAVTTTDKPIIG